MICTWAADLSEVNKIHDGRSGWCVAEIDGHSGLVGVSFAEPREPEDHVLADVFLPFQLRQTEDFRQLLVCGIT